MTTNDEIRVMAAGGTTYSVYRGDEFLGSMEHEAADDAEIVDAAREEFDLPADLPGRMVI